MPIQLLSEPIRKYIRDKRWEELRAIQAAAITRILTTSHNYILASKTASGKTEAAFLPILSSVNFNKSGVQVLYISPLIALINDQFYRIEELCLYLEVPVTKWHGEANRTQKKHLLKEPKGIVLITPESLEAMFVNNPYNVKYLFSNLKFIVIDEIHSFIGTDRGIQLKSILSRLQKINTVPFRIIGLSATIGDYEEAKQFVGNDSETKVLIDKTTNEIQVIFRYFKTEKVEFSLELLKDIYVETRNNKVLIFPNSRGKVEEIAVKLKKIAERVGGHKNYFSHHSSVNKDVREYIEFFAKNNKKENFTIACTSTLELGIDIGTVDKVIQVDATHSIASLIQRVGRSGRKEGVKSKLYLYSTDKWSLLQSLASWLLYKEEFIEPPLFIEKPFDIMLHQILSIVKEYSGVNEIELTKKIENNFTFIHISKEEINEIIDYLIGNDILEKLDKEIIIGIEGEKVVNTRDFYSVFKTEENYKVTNSGNIIGEIPFSPQIREDENILLAARIWKIKLIDFKSHKIEVCPAKDGKKPMFFGSGGWVHPRIREKMLEILISEEEYLFLDQPSSDEINKLQQEFSRFKILEPSEERPLLLKENKAQLYTFTGTRINRTIQLLLTIMDIQNIMTDNDSSFEFSTSNIVWDNFTDTLLNSIVYVDNHLSKLLEQNPTILDFSKWGILLPKKYQISLLKQKYYDLESTIKFLKSIKLVIK